jgi:hypothetical protein
MPSAFNIFGDPSTPKTTAADEPVRTQPFSKPLGSYTGVPPRTIFKNEQVAPFTVGQSSCIVAATRENRFVTLTAPFAGFVIYVQGSEGVSPSNGIALPPGLPYEISLPGNQALYAVTDAPVYLRVKVQIAAALAGDLERRL